MVELYARWIDRWEHDLATRDTNRVVRPFEWGLEWLDGAGFSSCPAEAEAGGDAAASVSRFVAEALSDSDRFYSYAPVGDYRLSQAPTTKPSPNEMNGVP